MIRLHRAALASCFSLSVATLGLLAGCSSGPEAARATARQSAGDFRANLQSMPGHIDTTIDKLAALIDARNTNPDATYAEFTKSLQVMDRDARDIGEQSDVATGNSEQFFREWTTAAMKTSDPAKRNEMHENMANRKAGYDTALEYLNNGRRSYRGLTDSLHDIESRLKGGVTQDALKSAGPSIQKAINEATNVKNYVARMTEQIDSMLGLR